MDEEKLYGLLIYLDKPTRKHLERLARLYGIKKVQVIRRLINDQAAVELLPQIAVAQQEQEAAE